MKKLIFILLSFSLVFSQQESSNRSLTIYKDNFAVIKEPIIWNLKSGSNITSFSNISKNLLFDSPVLNIEGVEVLSQTLNKNFSSTDSFLKNSIGSPVEIIPISGSRTEGLLMDINSSSISVKTSKGLVVFQRSQLLSFTLKSNSVQDKFTPEIVWELISIEEKPVNAELTYISSGFSWKPIYTLTINGDDSTASLMVNAEVTNNSNVSLFAANLKVVEGSVPLNSSSKKSSYQMMESRSAMDTRNSLGDFYIFDIGSNLKLDSMQSIQLPLMESRQITYDKKYIFENSERDQGDEPLSIEVSFENSASNNLELPLPSGVLFLYEKDDKNSMNFIGRNSLTQLYKGGVAILDGGKAFDIIGKRRILNFDRQSNSEESTISLQILNTSDKSIKVKAVEKIYGDWVIKESSSMYIKEDASTIYFPLEIEPGQTELITYTYKKEWK
ncbi:MAG: hypothetical protein CM15mP33_00290 [Candidatus Neomarinimicrobiota bacterium]|nr:MAG: hypothetical protein CM15mP33_00290 [Candidatus Neomarinimicrobiota bacterium]